MPPAIPGAGRCAFCILTAPKSLPRSLARCEVRRISSTISRGRKSRLDRLTLEVASDLGRKEGLYSTQAKSHVSARDEDMTLYRPLVPTGTNCQVSGTRKSSSHTKPVARYRLLLQLIVDRLNKLSTQKWKLPLKSWGTTKEKVDQAAHEIEALLIRGASGDKSEKEGIRLLERLKDVFIKDDVYGLEAELKYVVLNRLVRERSVVLNIEGNVHNKLVDIRYPLEWYPATRAMQRHVHLHVGPTNSGKTYHALKRLEAAESGVYAGPLRLLAHEVYTRMNAKGKACSLVTGEERRFPEHTTEATMSSCTVEMVPLNAEVDVAVIDEIQMLGDERRGWAWTQAFLGLQAKEIHLCGEMRTVPLVQDLCAAMGDKLVIHEYERLSPLRVANESLRDDLSKLQKGDCIILFSRLAIHAMKKEVEKDTGRRCAVVYGSLPPEIRAQQAALFNDPDNDYDFLVASDAVGMGLNLSIKRVIFESVVKRTFKGSLALEISDIKQIGGRAGRFKTAAQATDGPVDVLDGGPRGKGKRADSTGGIITTLSPMDLKLVRTAMDSEAPPLQTAGIMPPDVILQKFAAYFPKSTPFSYILLRLHEICRVGDHFHLCGLKEQVQIADLIQDSDLTIVDRIRFLAAPISLRDPSLVEAVKELAQCVASQKGGGLLELTCLKLELLNKTIADFPDGHKLFLEQLESLHKILTLYLWLSYRFAGVFKSQQLCFHVKGMVEERIDECLAEVAWNKDDLRRRHAYNRRKLSDTKKWKETFEELKSLNSDKPAVEIQEQDDSSVGPGYPSLLYELPEQPITPAGVDA